MRSVSAVLHIATAVGSIDPPPHSREADFLQLASRRVFHAVSLFSIAALQLADTAALPSLDDLLQLLLRDDLIEPRAIVRMYIDVACHLDCDFIVLPTICYR